MRREQTDELTYRFFVNPSATSMFYLKQPEMVINLNASDTLYYSETSLHGHHGPQKFGRINEASTDTLQFHF